MTERVSIIISNYNYGHYLAESIESALAQTYPDVEVIYIDDGSTDNSLEVAARYPITVLKQVNQGVSAARNNAAQFASGQYLLFLDADDILLPDAIARMQAHLVGAGPDVGYVYGQMEYFGYKTGLFASKEFSPKALAKGNFICVTSLIKRALFDEAGGFDKGFANREDWELFIRFLHHGYQGRLLPEPIMRCRKHRPPAPKGKKPFVNTRKNLVTSMLVFKYPRFFLSKLLRNPVKYAYYILAYHVAKSVNRYGPNRDLAPVQVK